MRILAAIPAGANLFPSKPSNPGFNDPLPSPPPPPLPLPTKTLKPPSPSAPSPPPSSSSSYPVLHSIHKHTRHPKPVSPGILSSSPDGTRTVLLGDSGVSYLLPGAPFEFLFSYSETPKLKPLAIREPAFLPFAPPDMPRPWTGKAPLLSKKQKAIKKRTRVFQPLGVESSPPPPGVSKVLEIDPRRPVRIGSYVDGRSREEILGAPLTRAEVLALLKPCLGGNRQVNLGRDGVTHNMLDLIHSHWRRREVCKVRCRGVPTVDMDNVCYYLEEKTGGKIIRRTGGVLYLFRGRNYNPRTRPRYPVMLWKPAAPVYPKLIQEVPEGLTKEEAEELRRKGQNLLPICKLAKNGIFLTLVKDVRDAFELSHLVKVNCQGLDPSDYKKIGAKLKDLVPCVLLSFDLEQILMWRGKDWKSRYHTPIGLVSNIPTNDDGASSYSDDSEDESTLNKLASSHKMVYLWKRALESNKALLLDDTELTPDSLLEKVEQFEGISQATEYTSPALIISDGGANTSDDSKSDDNDITDYGNSRNQVEDNQKGFDQDLIDFCEELESSVPFGSLAVDLIAERLHRER